MVWTGVGWTGANWSQDRTCSTGNASLRGSDWRSDACQLHSVLPPGPWRHVM